MNLAWVRMRTGRPAPLPTPEEAKAYPYTPQDLAAIREYRDLPIVFLKPGHGPRPDRGPVEETGVDEVMVSTMIHSPEERLRSYRLVAEAFGLPSSP